MAHDECFAAAIVWQSCLAGPIGPDINWFFIFENFLCVFIGKAVIRMDDRSPEPGRKLYSVFIERKYG